MLRIANTNFTSFRELRQSFGSSPRAKTICKTIACMMLVVFCLNITPMVFAEEAAKKPAVVKKENSNSAKADSKKANDKKTAADKKNEKWKGTPLDKKTEDLLKKQLPKTIADLRKIETQLQRVLKDVQPATVGLRVGGSAGSGVIVTPEGLVLTAAHVSGAANKSIWIILSDGRRVRAKTLGLNHGIDSGMVQITEKQEGGWPFVPMAKSKDIKKGQWVIATGHPGGFDRTRTAPVRLGRILFHSNSVICTDCTLVGGDSGGPLFNMRGEVIGIHSRIGRTITNNFHVPIETYHTTWDRLLAAQDWGGRRVSSSSARMRPFLGINLNGQEKRPIISQVNPGTPAAKAGLREGDIIRTLDGETISARLIFIQRILSKKPGAQIKIEVMRKGKTKMVNVRLGIRMTPLPGGPDHLKPAPAPKKKTTPKKPTTKPSKTPTQKMELALSESLGVEIDRASLRCIISRTVPGLAAEKSGIMPGDVVLEFAGKAIKSADELRVAAMAQAGKSVKIVLLRNGRKLTKTINVPK